MARTSASALARQGAGARAAQRGGASSERPQPRLRRSLARCRVAGLRPAPSTSPSEAPKHHITRRLRLLPCLASDACMLPRGHRATAAVSGAFVAEYGRLGRSRWGPGVQNPECPKKSNDGVGSGFQPVLGHFGSAEILAPGGARAPHGPGGWSCGLRRRVFRLSTGAKGGAGRVRGWDIQSAQKHRMTV